jgi:diguanylate cyclase (GGDEF)-like protein
VTVTWVAHGKIGDGHFESDRHLRTPQDKELIQRQITSTDKAIDGQVYELPRSASFGFILCLRKVHARRAESIYLTMSQKTEFDGFSKLILDSITEHIVVIEQDGSVLFSNKTWDEFGRNNGYAGKSWLESNYLKVCDDAAAAGDEFGEKASRGIREVLGKKLEEFHLEYPCHSPDEKRWFMMRVSPFNLEGETYIVISHQNITERKMIEEQILNLSRIDGLTNIPNRRYFDQFLEAEWRRCARLNFPITLALMDVDHFKLLNDHYGHPAGDECLIKIGQALLKIGKRPSDLVARFGGEEFSMVFGNTTIEQSLIMINKLVNDVDTLKIPNERSPTKPWVTISVGVAMMYPDRQNKVKDLINLADKRLYSAKQNGRNQVMFK